MEQPKNQCQGERVCANAPLRMFTIKHEVGATHITFCEKCWDKAKATIRSDKHVPKRSAIWRPADHYLIHWKELQKIESFAIASNWYGRGTSITISLSDFYCLPGTSLYNSQTSSYAHQSISSLQSEKHHRPQ